jgi:hypothetical protein
MLYCYSSPTYAILLGVAACSRGTGLRVALALFNCLLTAVKSYLHLAAIMDGRMLLQASESSQDTAPFFGFIGAASALVFSCKQHRKSGHVGPSLNKL